MTSINEQSARYEGQNVKAGLPLRQNFVSTIVTAESDMRDLISRLSALADKLLGSSPKSAGDIACDPYGEGHLPTICRMGESISSEIGEGHRLIERIESALP